MLEFKLSHITKKGNTGCQEPNNSKLNFNQIWVTAKHIFSELQHTYPTPTPSSRVPLMSSTKGKAIGTASDPDFRQTCSLILKWSFVNTQCEVDKHPMDYVMIFKYCLTSIKVSRYPYVKWGQGHSLNCRTSYRKISWSLEAARFGFRLFQSLWNFVGTLAAALQDACQILERCDYHNQSRGFETSRDFGGKTSYRLVHRGQKCLP